MSRGAPNFCCLRHPRAAQLKPAALQVSLHGPLKTQLTETSFTTTLRRVQLPNLMRLTNRASNKPSAAPSISATQSLRSALRPKCGCINSITPPKIAAPTNSPPNSSPRGTRRENAAGSTSSPKAARCTSLSVPLGTDWGTSTGVSIATARPAAKRAVTMRRGERKYMSAAYGLALGCTSLGCASRWRICL